MIGRYDYTVVLTYGNVVAGVLGIFTALSGNVDLSIVFLLLAGVFDMFDGAVAKSKKNRTNFEQLYGVEIDSLADLISFCMFPAVISYASGNTGMFAYVVYALFILAGLIRLAYYNVTEMEFKEQNQSRKYYEGLPVTSVSAIFFILFLAGKIFSLDMSVIYFAVIVVAAVAFLSKIKIRKIKINLQKR